MNLVQAQRAKQKIRMTSALVYLAPLGLVASLIGCMANPVPLSAQAGSTVSIPLGGLNTLQKVGYAGLAVEDPQRGELIFSLETSTGPFDLVTRGTTLIGTETSAPLSRDGAVEVYQVVSLIDIPLDAPHGTYPVSVRRRFTDPATGQQVVEPIDYRFTLSILPPQIDVVRDDGTLETIQGRVTPFERWNPLSGNTVDTTTAIPQTVPDPVVRMAFGNSPSAIEFELTYPPDVVDIQDAFQHFADRVNGRATTWIEDDGAGTVRVGSVANEFPIVFMHIVFSLDDPSVAILDPADVQVNVIRAWDQDGLEIASSASVLGIF